MPRSFEGCAAPAVEPHRAQRQIEGAAHHHRPRARVVEVEPRGPGRDAVVRIEPPSAGANLRTLIAFGEAQHRERAEPVVSDQTVKADLLSRIGDPDHPTTEMQILDWAARDKLSTRDTTLFREMVHTMGSELQKDPIVHATVAPTGAAGERLGVGLMLDGHQRYAQFMQQFWPEYMRQKNSPSGLPANALDLKDEKSLIRVSMKQFEPLPDERMRALLMKRLQGIGGDEGAAPAPSKPVTLPPKEKLEDGKLYDTARGQLKWDAKRGAFVTP